MMPSYDPDSRHLFLLIHGSMIIGSSAVVCAFVSFSAVSSGRLFFARKDDEIDGPTLLEAGI